MRFLTALRFASALLLVAAGPSRLDDAIELAHQGKLVEARDLLRTEIPGLRASGDQGKLARALTASSRIAVSLGDYRAALQDAGEALHVRQQLKDETGAGEDFNTLGLANQYLGEYAAARENYQQSLRIGRAHADAEGEITELNNIGNIFYFQGRYGDALREYQEALERVKATSTEPWNPWRRQLTLANLAALYQRLGKEQTALELYQQVAQTPKSMPPDEQAQLLLNEGVLYRKLGDPVKALDLYRMSQSLFAIAHHRDGEISALRNIGIALALDLEDLSGALDAFTRALTLAQQSSNTRGLVQALLHRGELLRRLHRLTEAGRDLQIALEGAQKVGLVEEHWKTLYALGQIADEAGQPERAMDCYAKAVEIIESVRTGLRIASLRSEFLADKRDVYDSVIALRLRQSPAPVEEIFRWIERSRARTLQERVAGSSLPPDPVIAEIQARLPPDAVLLDFWMGSDSSAMLWISASGAGVIRPSMPADKIRELAARLDRSMQGVSGEWKEVSRELGGQLLSGVPLRRHLIVVPDGALSIVPFEVLGVPSTDDLLIEKCDVSYLPSAQFIVRPGNSHGTWLPPWRRQLVAFGDPPVSSDDTLAGAERWQRLPASAEEVQAIARTLNGRSEIHLAMDARKRHLLGRSLVNVPLLHFSTHAVVDGENPDRSRILLAPDQAAMAFDYIFQEEVYHLDLQGVRLVTVSACDTARGKIIRGEGVEAFSRAFLAAGAAATVTSLWRVADQPTAEFMKQFYYFLSQGQTKAEALQSAKLQFLRSHSELADPRHWAAFVLNGDGWNPCPRVIGWSSVFCMGAGLLVAVAVGFRAARRRPTAGPAPH